MKRLSEIFAEMSQPAIDDLRDYVGEKIASVKGIDKIKMSLNPITMTIELHAANKAFNLLSEMFAEMMAISSREIGPKDPRDSFDTKFYGKRQESR